MGWHARVVLKVQWSRGEAYCFQATNRHMPSVTARTTTAMLERMSSCSSLHRLCEEGHHELFSHAPCLTA